MHVCFFLFIVCLYTCVCDVYFKTTIIKQNIKIILIAGVPSSQALPYYCDSICTRSFCTWRASSVDSKPTKKNGPPLFQSNDPLHTCRFLSFFCKSACLRARHYLHHAPPRLHTRPHTLTIPLHATILHSHLLPAHSPAPHSHLYFGYKLTVTARTTGLAPNVAKDRALPHPLTPWQSIQKAFVVPLSSPHQRAFVCGLCIGTAQVGVLLVSLFNPLFKWSRSHCFDICAT